MFCLFGLVVLVLCFGFISHFFVVSLSAMDAVAPLSSVMFAIGLVLHGSRVALKIHVAKLKVFFRIFKQFFTIYH